jgi:uncharacterized protein YdaU (DUF1376 family)
MNYFQLHIGDYLASASHLTLLEHGVFIRLLMVYYNRQGGIPDDHRYRIIAAVTPEDKAAVDAVLSDAQLGWTLIDGVWRQSRCDSELAAFKAKQTRAAENGKLGGRPKQDEPEENPEETPLVISETKEVIFENQNERVSKANHKPITNNQEPILNPLPPSGASPPGGREPPWWELSDNLLARNLVLAIRGAKHYPNFEPDEPSVLALLAFVSEFAPDDDLILSVAEQFAERSNVRKSRQPEYTDPIKALRKWYGMREADWRKIRRQRGYDLNPRTPKLTLEQEFEEVARSLGVGS